jgi:hypothetical protein
MKANQENGGIMSELHPVCPNEFEETIKKCVEGLCENLSMDSTSFKDAGRSHMVGVQNADVEVEA